MTGGRQMGTGTFHASRSMHLSPFVVAGAALVACAHPVFVVMFRSLLDGSAPALRLEPAGAMPGAAGSLVHVISMLANALVVAVDPFLWPLLAATAESLLAPVSSALLVVAVSWCVSLPWATREVRWCWWGAVALCTLQHAFGVGHGVSFLTTLLLAGMTVTMTIVTLLARVPVRRHLILPALFVLACTATTYTLPSWESRSVLSQRAIAIAPRAAKAHVALAATNALDADAELDSLRTALQLDPRDPEVRRAVGHAYAARGEWNEAARHFYKIAELRPDDAGRALEAADAAARAGQALRARTLVARAADSFTRDELRTEPAPPVLVALARKLAQREDWPNADYVYARVRTASDSSSTIAREHALVMLEAGRDAEAVRSLRESLSIDDANVDAAVDLAWLLATSDQMQRTSAGDALLWASRAASLRPRDPAALDTLAAAQAANGDYDAAVASATHALALGEATGDAEWLAAVRTRIETYRSGRPYRQ
jgi:tetratricopeptide (TPR) repeat protein